MMQLRRIGAGNPIFIEQQAFRLQSSHGQRADPNYFRNDVLAKRTYISMEWCQAAITTPVCKEVQPEDGRIRHWVFVPELDKNTIGDNSYSR